MKYFVAVLILVFSSLTVSAKGLSSRRFPNESYKAARNRNYFLNYLYRYSPKPFPADVTKEYVTAEDSQKPLSELDFKNIPSLGSYEALEKTYKFIRDTRFIPTADPKFPRRITWMYPDDGCYVRAEYAKFQIQRRHLEMPKKIFVFGNLFAPTPNTLSGTVSWWYHVGLVYRVANEVYVFDPSLEPNRPLTLKEWDHLVGGSQIPMHYSICSADTFDPSSDCSEPAPETAEQTLSTQKSFLDSEWYRLIELNRNPEAELGNNPPWL